MMTTCNHNESTILKPFQENKLIHSFTAATKVTKRRFVAVISFCQHILQQPRKISISCIFNYLFNCRFKCLCNCLFYLSVRKSVCLLFVISCHLSSTLNATIVLLQRWYKKKKMLQYYKSLKKFLSLIFISFDNNIYYLQRNNVIEKKRLFEIKNILFLLNVTLRIIRKVIEKVYVLVH